MGRTKTNLVDIKTNESLKRFQIVTTIRNEKVTLFSWECPTEQEIVGSVSIIDSFGRLQDVSPAVIGAQFI